MGIKLNIRIENHVDIDGVCQQAETHDGFLRFAASEWYRLMEQFTPFDTGHMWQSGATPAQKAGEIRYGAPYSGYVYEMTGANFQTVHHKDAAAKWDEAAEPSQLPKLYKSIQGYINKNMRLE